MRILNQWLFIKVAAKLLNRNKKLYLIHVLFHYTRNISAGLVVAKESTLQSPLIQQVHRMSLECIIFTWYSNKYCNTPTLTRSKFLF